LTIDNCNKLQTLPASLQKLRVLKQFTLRQLNQLREMPNPTALAVLDSLTIEFCPDIKVLPASLGRLGALKQLTLRGLDELRKLPDPVGLTSLERLTLGQCKRLKVLPVSIRHVSRLRHLSIDWCSLEDMPCIKALTALHTLELYFQRLCPLRGLLRGQGGVFKPRIQGAVALTALPAAARDPPPRRRQALR
jgi:Leucine-rich repeat (LRR) protein